MNAILFAFLLLFTSISGVVSAPLPLDLTLPPHADPAHAKVLNAVKDEGNLSLTVYEVNKQITAMEAVVANPGTADHQTMLKICFGDHFDIKGITEGVHKLKTAVLKVTDVYEAAMPAGVKAKTSDGGTAAATIRFGPDFYDGKKTSDDGRTGTLLHEASHYVMGTWDYFTKPDKKPIQKTEYNKDPSANLSGYMPADYHDLKAGGFTGMHTNADSWKSFGFYALHGRPHNNMDPSTMRKVP